MRKQLTRKERYNIYRRDGFQCALCSGTSGLQIHHWCHRGQGGNDTPHNLVTLCATCHAQIHGYIPYEAEDYTTEWAEQSIAEYLADMYAPDWWPYQGDRPRF